MIIEAEILKVEAKKDGIDRMYKVTFQTSDPQTMKLDKYIATDTVKLEIKE